MPKIQTPSSRTRRFFNWFTRHKVVAVFTVLLLAGTVYFFGSWAVFDIQVHFERQRFMKTKQTLESFAIPISKIGAPQIDSYHNCSYTSNGAVFATRFLGCETGLEIAYRDISKSQAQSLTSRIGAVLGGGSIHLRDNRSAGGKYDASVYVFDSSSMACIFTTSYYDESVTESERDSDAPRDGRVAFMVIGCSGSAKAEYFPVTNS